MQFPTCSWRQKVKSLSVRLDPESNTFLTNPSDVDWRNMVPKHLDNHISRSYNLVVVQSRASESEEIHLWINIGAHPYQYRLQTEVGNFSASSGIENCITGIPQYFTNCLKYVMCIIDDELLTLGKGGHIQIDVPHFLTFFADRAYHFLPSATGGGIASWDLTFVYWGGL